MLEKLKLNGNFVVCKKLEQEDLIKKKGFLLFNKETVPKYKIVKKHFDESIDFPFEKGDVVCSASTGTIVKLDGEKIWLFQPEHILAKII